MADLKPTEMIAKLAAEWKELDEKEKKVYEAKSKEEKKRVDEKVKKMIENGEIAWGGSRRIDP